MYICNIARLWQQKVEIMRRTVKMRCFRKKSLKTKPLCWLAIFPALSYIWLRQLDTESCADSNIDTILLQAHSPVMFFYSLYTHKVTLLHYFLLYSPVQGLSVLSSAHLAGKEGEGSRGSGPLPFFVTTQIVLSNS